MVGVYINTMKTTFLFEFWFITSISLITSLQVNKERDCYSTLLFFPCLWVSTLFESLVGMKNSKRKSSIRCIDKYDDNYIPWYHAWYGRGYGKVWVYRPNPNWDFKLRIEQVKKEDNVVSLKTNVKRTVSVISSDSKYK